MNPEQIQKAFPELEVLLNGTNIYVKATKKLRKWLRYHYKDYNKVVTFKHLTTGKSWLSIPLKEQ